MQIKELEDLLQEKSENCEELEAAKNRLDAELKLQQSTICELRDVIRHLETDLDARCKVVRQHEQVSYSTLVKAFRI
jgi:chromosome segregation ATPase